MAVRDHRASPLPPLDSRGRKHELLWEGKYDGQGRRRDPDVSPGAVTLVPAEGHAVDGLFVGTAPGWVDRLVLGDNLDALRCLLPELRGAVQLIYLDPPFGSDADYRMGAGNPTSSGLSGGDRALAYRDRWSAGETSYLAFMADRLVLMRELLTESGTLFLHCDWHSHAVLRLLLDEIFGADRFVNEIVWHYFNKFSRGRHCLPRAHDSILLYSRGRNPALYPLRTRRETPSRQLVRESVNGVLRNARDAEGKLKYQVVHDKKADDVWTIPQLQPASAEWTGYATQKHPLLLERILALASRPGDLIADFFCGSGTTLAVAQRMERRFVGCDLGATAVHISRRRLVQTPGPHAPLAVLAVRGAEPAALRRRAGHRVALQREWVLARMQAVPESGSKDVHGRLLGAWVHLHLEASPFTATEAARVADRVKLKPDGKVLCCAWDFESTFWDRLARSPGGEAVVPVQLPREWLRLPADDDAVPAVLPKLRIRVHQELHTVRVTVAGFYAPALARVLSDPEERPETRAVDCWGVDPEWAPGKPFTPAWFAAKQRRQPSAPLTSPALRIGSGGCALVQAWDALGSSAMALVTLK